MTEFIDPKSDDIDIKEMIEIIPPTVAPRSRARGFVIEVLYEVEITDHDPYVVFQRRLDDQRTKEHGDDDAPLKASSIEFSQQLLKGILENQFLFNRLITEYAPEWPLNQIAVLDRNIMSLAMYEILYLPKTPMKVVINEAIELAKLYASDNSPRFINGVLGTFTDNIDKIREELGSSAE